MIFYYQNQQLFLIYYYLIFQIQNVDSDNKKSKNGKLKSSSEKTEKNKLDIDVNLLTFFLLNWSIIGVKAWFVDNNFNGVKCDGGSSGNWPLVSIVNKKIKIKK